MGNIIGRKPRLLTSFLRKKNRELFNLEEYLANPTKRLITRDGCDARIICTDAKSEKYQVVALVTKKGGQEILATLETSGKFRSGYNSHLDLFFSPEKHEGWVNLYKSGIGWSLGTSIWQTEEEAKKWVGAADYATTIKIEWEE